MELQGILPLLKPKGMTSHDCVARLRRILKTRKVGHTGTLDPEVTGVLPICIGRATKVAEYMSDYSKTYEGEVTIGTSTTTEDFTGEVVEKKVIEQPLTVAQIEEVLNHFTGKIEQIPPMYSAVKIKGKKLYEYAREGKIIDRPKREVVIYKLERTSEPMYIDNEKIVFLFRVHCSKGTYVRTLAVDIGKKLGFPAHMSALVRTASGPFKQENCLTFEEIERLQENNEVQAALLPIEAALAFLPKLTVTDEVALKVLNGAVLPLAIDENRFTVYNKNGELLAIYQKHPTKEGFMKPEKIIKIISA